MISQHIRESAEQEQHIEEYIGYIRELKLSVNIAVRQSKSNARQRDNVNILSSQRLDKLQEIILEKDRIRDKLNRVMKTNANMQCVLERYEEMMRDSTERAQLELKKHFKVGRRGGARYPLWVVQVCIELLVHGTPPSAVVPNIATLYEVLYKKDPEELPSIQFVRQIRAAVQVLGETICAIKLANATEDMWKQFFF